jgi:hypothetical protein
VHTGYLWGDLREREHLEDLGLEGGGNINAYLQDMGGGDMDWIDLAQDRGRWRALVNAVINLRIP